MFMPVDGSLMHESVLSAIACVLQWLTVCGIVSVGGPLGNFWWSIGLLVLVNEKLYIQLEMQMWWNPFGFVNLALIEIKYRDSQQDFAKKEVQ
jgi:hypothetical protein